MELWIGDSKQDLAPWHEMEALFNTITNCVARVDDYKDHWVETNYPAFTDLRSGRLTPARASDALGELAEIEAALRAAPLSKLVLDVGIAIKDAVRRTETVNLRATNVFDYFVNREGTPLVSALQTGVRQCRDTNQVLWIRLSRSEGDGLKLAVIPLGGLAWTILGWAFAPNLRISRGGVTLRVWPLGIYIVFLGLLFALSAIPTVGFWMRRHMLWFIFAVFLATAVLIVVGARNGLFS